MICREIIEKIEERYPREYALSWDNVGLLTGRDDKEVQRIYVALDATEEIIEDAIAYGADLLVTHHPLIFEAVRKVTNQDFIGRRMVKLLQQDISYYVMHTNYDVLGMAELASDRMGLLHAEILELTADGEKPQGIGRIGESGQVVSLLETGERVKEAFALNHVKIFGNPQQLIRKIAIAPGSGKSMIDTAIQKGADVLVTGDIGHHEGIDAVAQGLMVIDAGHYGLEHIFIPDMCAYFRDHLEHIEVMGAPVVHPFHII